MTGRRTRRVAARWLAVLVVAAAGPAVVGLSGDVAAAGVPPPTGGTPECADFAALQETVIGIGAATTPKQTFASVHRVARVFRQVARDAPDVIADDMRVLSASIGALDRKLASVASSIGPARSRGQLDEMLGDIRAVFASWTRSQDVEALAAAQSAVDDWLEATCGFRLGAGDAGTGATTASCDSAEGAVAAVLAAWNAGDRAGAAQCGTDPAVTKLFSLPVGVALTPAGCTGVDSTTVDCSYRYEGGSLSITVTKSGTGWKVTDVTGRPD